MTVVAHQAQAQMFSLGPPEMILKDHKSSESFSCEPAVHLLDLLVQDVENSLQAVATNVAVHVKIHPIHGILQCINKCQMSISGHIKNVQCDLQNWPAKLENVVKLNYRVIDFTLDILAGGKSIADCPSFADIGSALEHLVSLEEDRSEETTTLSPEFQLLLSWCWINLK
ncbi:thyroid adenoma-associated protein, partial [Elysia marginata]